MYVLNHDPGPWEIACEGGDVGVFGAEGLGVCESAGFRVVRWEHVRAVADGENPLHGPGGRDAVGFAEGFREVELKDRVGVDVQRAVADGAFGFKGIGVEALSPVGDARGDATPGNGISVDG